MRFADSVGCRFVLFGGFIDIGLSGETWGLGVPCYANCDGSPTPPVLTECQ
jgi:hypothetical protein